MCLVLLVVVVQLVDPFLSWCWCFRSGNVDGPWFLGVCCLYWQLGPFLASLCTKSFILMSTLAWASSWCDGIPFPDKEGQEAQGPLPQKVAAVCGVAWLPPLKPTVTSLFC